MPFQTISAQSVYPPPINTLSSSEFQYPAPDLSRPISDNTENENLITVEISIDVTVEGLENDGSVELELLSDTQATTARLESLDIVLPAWNFQNESRTITVAALPIGTYKLLIDASEAYFRKPQGYVFLVTAEGIVNYSNEPFHFELIPPSGQDFPPCRDFTPSSAPSSDEPLTDVPFVEPEITCRAESFEDISSPPKQPVEQQPEGILSTGYHYVGPWINSNNQGVWGRNYVVDPSVRHTVGLAQFVVERVYANDSTYEKWMEAGWAEHWSREDSQYIYEFDSATHTWHYFDQFVISVGSPVETQVYYSSLVGKWRAIYYYGDSSWALLAEESLGFTAADNGFNRGEILTLDGVHPLLPMSKFDKSYLLISDIWRVWDTRYLASIQSDPPYQCDMLTEYTFFTIHSPMIFLPVILSP